MMSDSEKQRFQQMADRDKLRFDTEMKSYQPPFGGRVSKKKTPKDPNAPKRSLSAFFWYVVLFCNKLVHFHQCSFPGSAMIFANKSRSSTQSSLLVKSPKSWGGAGVKWMRPPRLSMPPELSRIRLVMKE